MLFCLDPFDFMDVRNEFVLVMIFDAIKALSYASLMTV